MTYHYALVHNGAIKVKNFKWNILILYSITLWMERSFEQIKVDGKRGKFKGSLGNDSMTSLHESDDGGGRVVALIMIAVVAIAFVREKTIVKGHFSNCEHKNKMSCAFEAY